MKIAILGTVHPKGLEFLKNNEFEVFEVGNFEIQSLKESLKNVDGILLRTSKLDQDILQPVSYTHLTLPTICSV